MTRASITRWIAVVAATSAFALQADAQLLELTQTSGGADERSALQLERARQIQAATPRPTNRSCGGRHEC